MSNLATAQTDDTPVCFTEPEPAHDLGGDEDYAGWPLAPDDPPVCFTEPEPAHDLGPDHGPSYSAPDVEVTPEITRARGELFAGMYDESAPSEIGTSHLAVAPASVRTARVVATTARDAFNADEMSGHIAQSEKQAERQRLVDLYSDACRLAEEARVGANYRDLVAKDESLGSGRHDEMASAAAKAHEDAFAAKADIARSITAMTDDSGVVYPDFEVDDIRGHIGKGKTALGIAREDASLEQAAARPDQDVWGNTMTTVATTGASMAMGAFSQVPLIGTVFKGTDSYKRNQRALINGHDAMTGNRDGGELAVTLGEAGGGAAMQLATLGLKGPAKAVHGAAWAMDRTANAASVVGQRKTLDGQDVDSDWGVATALLSMVTANTAVASSVMKAPSMILTNGSRAQELIDKTSRFDNVMAATEGAAKGTQALLTTMFGEDVLAASDEQLLDARKAKKLSGSQRLITGIQAAAEGTGAVGKGSSNEIVSRALENVSNAQKIGLGAGRALGAGVGMATGYDPVAGVPNCTEVHGGNLVQRSLEAASPVVE